MADKTDYTPSSDAGWECTLGYNSWVSMKQRCTNPNDKRYAAYGGRGIKVCDRWFDSFENFLADMGKRPSLKHSIDRIDNDGNYEPGNCRWATNSRQIFNRHSYGQSGFAGVRQSNGKWEASIRKEGKRHYLGRYENKEDAIAARKAAEIHLYDTTKANTDVELGKHTDLTDDILSVIGGGQPNKYTTALKLTTWHEDKLNKAVTEARVNEVEQMKAAGLMGANKPSALYEYAKERLAQLQEESKS